VPSFVYYHCKIAFAKQGGNGTGGNEAGVWGLSGGSRVGVE